MIHFVGAGPGAVDLITLRGQKLLREADIVIYAGSLVNSDLLACTGENCKVYDSKEMCLEEVLAVMEQAEADGLTTVRLHTGDPSVFGAIREQMDALREKNIAFDICPGVSSMFGAAAALQCEYTLPEVSQTVIITRGEGKTPVPEKERLSALAVHGATMVLFLSSGMAQKVQEELLFGGYAENTPVGIVYRATWQDERTVRTTLGMLAETVEREEITKTALIVVGDVLGDLYAKSKLYDAGFSTEFRQAKCTQEEEFWQAERRQEEEISQQKKQEEKNSQDVLMLACTPLGYELMQRTKYLWERDRERAQDETDGGIPSGELICIAKCQALGDISDSRSLSEIVRTYLPNVRAILFFAAAGIAVRTMAPFLKHKSEDAAVLALDETGKYCISLLAGHAGGANCLTEYVATLIGAEPVITTATDRESKFSVDMFAKKNGLVMTDWTMAKEISAAILAGETIGVVTDCRLAGELPEELAVCGGKEKTTKYRIKITADTSEIYRDTDNALVLVPKCFTVGIGCKSNTPESAVREAVKVCMDMYGADMRAIAAVASIDIKEDEPGLVEFCRGQDVPYMTYDERTLNGLEGEYTGSAFVEQTTGVDNVCERSAMAAANTFIRVDDSYGKPEFICRKTAMNGVTVSIVQMERILKL